MPESSSVRGPGPEAAYAFERAVDGFARAAGLDPARVPLRPHRVWEAIRHAGGPYPVGIEPTRPGIDRTPSI